MAGGSVVRRARAIVTFLVNSVDTVQTHYYVTHLRVAVLLRVERKRAVGLRFDE